jgi:hypothetical protein
LAPRADTEAIAAAIVRSLAPATDDPDHDRPRPRHDRAAAPPRPGGAVPVEEAIAVSSALQDPATLRELLHGDRASACTGCWQLRAQELVGTSSAPSTAPARPGDPTTGRSRTTLASSRASARSATTATTSPACHSPPSCSSPRSAPSARSRHPRARARRRTQAATGAVDLGDPARDLPVCYYALHRVAVAEPTTVVPRSRVRGAFQVFARRHRSAARGTVGWNPGPQRRYVPLQLPAGSMRLLMKTCTADRHSAALRWVDAEGATMPAIQEIAATAPRQPVQQRATVEPTTFVTALDVFARAANAAAASPTVRIAALRCATRYDADLQALAIADTLQQDPTTDPAEMLALAEATRALALPDELRTATARALEEKAIAALPAEHQQARLAEARLLEQQDRREDAMRMLAKHPRTGPMTWSYRQALAERLHFGAENVPLLREWSEACPRDPRPLHRTGQPGPQRGDAKGALTLLLAADCDPAPTSCRHSTRRSSSPSTSASGTSCHRGSTARSRDRRPGHGPLPQEARAARRGT